MSNNDPYLAGISTMKTYILYRNRNDMSYQEYNQYVLDWNTFEKVWTQDYYLSTIGATNRYNFKTYNEKESYMKGQAAHIDVYDSNSPGRILGTINVVTNVFAPSNQFTTIR